MTPAPDRFPTGSPLFSVIVLNWNGRHLLGECLDSILSQTFRDFEVIVVDNGSTDGSAGWVRERYAESVRMVELPENRGFAGGNNEGIRVARGRYVVLLNNDTEVDPGWLSALAGAAGRHPDAGMFASKILNYYRRDEIDNTGLVIYPDGLARGRDRLEKDDGRFDEEGEALVPSGCAGTYRKEMLDRVGLLDESFFAYGEDVDLGLRGRWAGWACRYVPRAVVYHRYSATAGAYSPRKAFLVERNRLWLLLKNFPLREILLSPLHTANRYRFHLQSAFGGRGSSGRFVRRFSIWRLFSVGFTVYLFAWVGLPRIIRERCRFRPRRKLSPSVFRRLLRKFRLSAREAAEKD